MDEKCDELLDKLLDEAADAFQKTRISYLKTGDVDDYIKRIGNLMSIVMSVKTGLALLKPPMYVGSFPEVTDHEVFTIKEEPE